MALDRRRIEIQQHVDVRSRPAAELIDLIRDLEGGRQPRCRRVARVLDAERHRLMPGMAVEIRADERTVLRPTVEGVGGAVRTEKALAFADGLQKGGLAFGGHGRIAIRAGSGQIAGRIEEKSIELL